MDCANIHNFLASLFLSNPVLSCNFQILIAYCYSVCWDMWFSLFILHSNVTDQSHLENQLLIIQGLFLQVVPWGKPLQLQKILFNSKYAETGETFCSIPAFFFVCSICCFGQKLTNNTKYLNIRHHRCY